MILRKKAQLFNIFFWKQCSLIPNNSSLPAGINYITDKRVSTVTFSARDIGKIVQNLDSNKTHGHDNLSIRMLKYVMILLVYCWRKCLKKLFLMVCFLLNGKKKILLPFTKKAKNKISKLIDLFFYFRLW